MKTGMLINFLKNQVFPRDAELGFHYRVLSYILDVILDDPGIVCTQRSDIFSDNFFQVFYAP